MVHVVMACAVVVLVGLFATGQPGRREWEPLPRARRPLRRGVLISGFFFLTMVFAGGEAAGFFFPEGPAVRLAMGGVAAIFTLLFLLALVGGGSGASRRHFHVARRH